MHDDDHISNTGEAGPFLFVRGATKANAENVLQQIVGETSLGNEFLRSQKSPDTHESGGGKTIESKGVKGIVSCAHTGTNWREYCNKYYSKFVIK